MSARANDAPFLDVLATCLGSGVSLPDALARIETAGPVATRWVARIRPFVRAQSRPETSLREAGAIDDAEHALLALALTGDEIATLLHTLALRRRRRSALGQLMLRGLVGPFSVAALSVILDPLPNLIGNGSYLGPVLLGLLVLAFVAGVLVVGVPAALRSPSIAPGALAICARFPLVDRLAARHAEAELVTLAAPFVARPADTGDENAGLLLTSKLLAWSPLGEKLRVATMASKAAPDLALARLAPHLSMGTNLSIVNGIASGRLPSDLASRGDEMAVELAARLRFLLRVASYTLVAVLTIGSLAGLVSRALPGMPLLPGVTPTTDQKELEEIMKELEGPAPSPPPK